MLLRRSPWVWAPVAALGVLGGAALADAGPWSWSLRGLLFLLPLLACGRALWVLLPGLGGVDALRWSGDAWSLRRRGRWFPASCVARVEVHQSGWWLVFRGEGGRAWVWVGMRPAEAEAGAERELARALRSGPRETSGG